MSKVARNEMHRLQKIEEDYPIKIEQYLTTEVNSFVTDMCTVVCYYYRDILIGVLIRHIT